MKIVSPFSYDEVESFWYIPYIIVTILSIENLSFTNNNCDKTNSTGVRLCEVWRTIVITAKHTFSIHQRMADPHSQPNSEVPLYSEQLLDQEQ